MSVEYDNGLKDGANLAKTTSGKTADWLLGHTAGILSSKSLNYRHGFFDGLHGLHEVNPSTEQLQKAPQKILDRYRQKLN